MREGWESEGGETIRGERIVGRQTPFLGEREERNGEVEEGRLQGGKWGDKRYF